MSTVPCPSIIREPARDIPVIDTADVVVIGAGPGGVGAAVAAARNGARTVLVERFGSFGGTWTQGILSAVMPFPFVRGIFGEIAAAMRREVAAWNPWDNQYGSSANYDTEAIKIVLDRLVIDAGVRPLFFAHAAAILREGRRLDGVVIESREGRHAIRGRQFIDATGDGDVCALAGVPFGMGAPDGSGCQPMSMIFKMSGVDDARADAYRKEEDHHMERAWGAARKRGEVTVPREDVLSGKLPRPGQWQFNTTRIPGKDATRLRDVTEAMIEGRRQVAEVATFLRKNIPGFERAVVSETAAHVGVRESRRIHCDYRITPEDIVEARAFDDCIARGNWFIDIHSPTGEGTTRIHPPEGRWYEIPYRSIRPEGIDNLLVASRCIDSTHESHAAIRITPQITAIGQGAGTAAALCIRLNLPSTRMLDAALLRNTLREQGAFV
ncbi:MAG: FAD-dependent oxidoreductase [Opitutaceae bacterium]|jgi:hypothetical protein|nr:FAD-dependent oxidoreductase [Opitutaceae bacterium]